MAELTFPAHVVAGQLQFHERLDDFEGQEVRVTLSSPAAHRPEIVTAADLLSSQVVGIWADRTDIIDGPSYAKELREQAQHRGVSVNAPRQ